MSEKSDVGSKKQLNPRASLRERGQNDGPERKASADNKANTNGNQRKEQSSQSKQQQKSEQANRQTNGEGKERKPRKRKKKNLIAQLTDASKVLEHVLANAKCKDLNLSVSAEAKFREDPSRLKALKQVTYDSTIDEDRSEISVLPPGLRGHVNLSPSAMTSLDCIHSVPARRHIWRRRNRKGGDKSKQQQQNKAQDSTSASSEPLALPSTAT